MNAQVPSVLGQAMAKANFGQLLRQFRKDSHLTQARLAAQIGVHSSYISRIECGERDIAGREFVMKTAEALKLDRRRTNQLLLSAGYAPVPRREEESSYDPTLSLITDLFNDKRVSDSELNPLREYARLLDQLRRHR